MKNLNVIGLDKTGSEKMINKLNDLLANYQILYQNTRGFHWNVKGEKFFVLHEKFEELYDSLAEQIDEIAERILTLGGAPVHTFKGYLDISDVKPVENETNGSKCVQHILNAFTILLSKEREILDLAGDNNDEGTNAMISEYIGQKEKLAWMYNAFLG